MRQCQVDGCQEKHFALGYCEKHYGMDYYARNCEHIKTLAKDRYKAMTPEQRQERRIQQRKSYHRRKFARFLRRIGRHDTCE